MDLVCLEKISNTQQKTELPSLFLNYTYTQKIFNLLKKKKRHQSYVHHQTSNPATAEHGKLAITLRPRGFELFQLLFH